MHSDNLYIRYWSDTRRVHILVQLRMDRGIAEIIKLNEMTGPIVIGSVKVKEIDGGLFCSEPNIPDESKKIKASIQTLYDSWLETKLGLELIETNRNV